MMPRLRSNNNLAWAFQKDDPNAVYNARLVLALLQCVRRLPRTVPDHLHDQLGATVGPLLPGLGTRARTELRRAIQALIRLNPASGTPLEDEDPDPWERAPPVGY